MCLQTSLQNNIVPQLLNASSRNWLIKMKTAYYTGTSGLLLPVPNKEFYPEAFKDKSRLHYYGSLFNSIEINSSFYKMPLAATIGKWAADVPDDFRFTFKLPKEITHNKGLDFDEEQVREFFRRISFAGEKRACVLVQFPGSIKPVFRRELEHLLGILAAADPGHLWHTCIEFRHQSWYTQDTYDLLAKYEMGLVLHDKLSEGGSFKEVSPEIVYVRFHGPEGDYRGSYTDEFLYEYASYIKEWLQEGKTVYTYFNNTMGNALENLRVLRAAVEAD